MSDIFAVRGPAEPTRYTIPAAMTIGRLDWINRMPHNPHAFQSPELQREYDEGYNREVRHARDANRH